MGDKALRIAVFLLIFSAIFLPSIARSSGLWVHEIYRFQESLGGDKATHFLAGAALQIAALILLSKNWEFMRIFLAWLIANLLLLGEEISQHFISSRHFEWSDLGWNFLGSSAVCAVVAILFLAKRLNRDYEDKFP